MREQDEEWLNFSRVARQLYGTFYNLRPKQLGQPGKTHKNLLKSLAEAVDSGSVANLRTAE